MRHYLDLQSSTILNYLANFSQALVIATITILIRCCFRVAELHAGYEGSVANNEVLYMVLEGAMMLTAVASLTAGHPGLTLGSIWQANGFHFRKPNTLAVIGEAEKEHANHSPA